MAQSPSPAPVRPPRSIVVVGASAGGVPALRRLVSGLHPDLEAAVVVVLHLPPNARSVLPDILTRAGALPAAHPRDREPLVAGQIYVAPPDRHLLLQDEILRLTVGPCENDHRRSVDALFRSAACWHGAAVISVVLTGALDDGAAGVAAIAGHGGTVLVQNPADAEVAGMPTRALEAVPDAFIGTVEDIARQINKLVRDARARTAPRPPDAYTDEFEIAEGTRRTPEQMREAPGGSCAPTATAPCSKPEPTTCCGFAAGLARRRPPKR